MDETNYKQLSVQRTSDEMDELDRDGADWQYGYDCVVKGSRGALARITALEAENAKIKAALYDTRKSAALLLQNVETANYEWLQGAPGWVIDCRKSIDNAAAALKEPTTTPAITPDYMQTP